MLRRSVAPLLVLALVGFGCVGTDPSEDLASDSLPIVGGTEVQSRDTPAVYLEPDCSATKVGSHLLLTAAHCVLNDPNNRNSGLKNVDHWKGYTPGHKLVISRGRRFPETTQTVTVVETKVYPYVGERGVFVDLAIIIISEEIQGDTARIGGRVWSGRAITVMGVGCTGTGGTSDEILRSSSGVLCTRVEDSSSTFDAEVPGSFVSAACEGDSGGPAFVTEGDGTQLLVGIIKEAQDDSGDMGWGKDGHDGIGVRMTRLNEPNVARWLAGYIK
jgi:hypothetical protein